MARPTQAIRRPEQKQARLPMPSGGLNYVSGPLDFPVTDAYYLDNLIPKSFGVEIRKGWRYWMPKANAFATTPDPNDGAPAGVRTIMSYRALDPANDKLFCSPSSTGYIYDITTQNTAPVQVAAGGTAGTAKVKGEWYYIQFGAPGGQYLCCVCLGAGYYKYTTGAGWTNAGITFPDSTTELQISYIFTWKNRIWFLKEHSTIAYYLPVNSVTGACAAFDFGPLLAKGGSLAIGASWTYDSGKGIDDSLIIVSHQGDVLLYEGTDPATLATFSLKGLWYAGRLPAGRRGVTQHGGNTLFLTEFGLIAISDLVAGKLHSTELTQSFGYKINSQLALNISANVSLKYWYLVVNPVEDLLIVGTPMKDAMRGNVAQSFVMNSLNNSWATISNKDILCAEMFKGNFIFGDRNGNVCQGFYGYRDGTSADSGVTAPGSEVTGKLQGAFYDYGINVMNKRMLRVKVYGIADGIPNMVVRYKSEYNLTSVPDIPSPALVPQSSWDNATWDQSLWDSGGATFRRWIGVSGWGKMLSFQMAIRGMGKTLVTDFEALHEIGYNL